MGLAVLNYESTRKYFPRGRWNLLPTDTGKHNVPDRSSAKSNDASWAVVVLPYAEEQNIASQYDLKKEWFHSDNRPPVSYPLAVFVCPSVPERSRFDVNFTTDPKPAAGDYGSTNGVGTGVWNLHFTELGTYPGNLPNGNGEDNPQVIGVMTKALLRQPCRAKDIIDGTSKTLLIAEDAGRPDPYTDGHPGNASGLQIPIDAGTGWADPDSGFMINTEPVIDHRNDGEIYGFHPGGASLLRRRQHPISQQLARYAGWHCHRHPRRRRDYSGRFLAACTASFPRLSHAQWSFILSGPLNQSSTRRPELIA